MPRHDFPARRGGLKRRLAHRVQGPRKHHVVVVHPVGAKARVLLHGVVLLDPAQGRVHARITLLEPRIEQALEARVGHRSIRPKVRDALPLLHWPHLHRRGILELLRERVPQDRADLLGLGDGKVHRERGGAHAIPGGAQHDHEVAGLIVHRGVGRLLQVQLDAAFDLVVREEDRLAVRALAEAHGADHAGAAAHRLDELAGLALSGADRVAIDAGRVDEAALR